MVIAGKSKLARRIRKEIVKVRRKLAIQKGQHVSDIEDTADTGGEEKEKINGSSYKSEWTRRDIVFEN